jgi:hypothetical protein
MEDNEDFNLTAQIRISKILSRGFIFSIVWLAGLGSLVALISGIYALRLINKSKGQLTGKWMAWWCIIAGAFGVVLLPMFIATHR